MMAMSPLNAVKLEQTSDCSKETQCSCQKNRGLLKGSVLGNKYTKAVCCSSFLFIQVDSTNKSLKF